MIFNSMWLSFVNNVTSSKSSVRMEEGRLLLDFSILCTNCVDVRWESNFVVAAGCFQKYATRSDNAVQAWKPIV